MSETKKDRDNEEARVPEDPQLRGHSLQDHDRVNAENDPDGNPNRTDPARVAPERDEALEEVRRVRAENEERTQRRSTVEVVAEVAAMSPAGNEDVKPVTLVTAGGRLYLNSHGEKVLDHDGVVALQQHLAAAFQAVS